MQRKEHTLQQLAWRDSSAVLGLLFVWWRWICFSVLGGWLGNPGSCGPCHLCFGRGREKGMGKGDTECGRARQLQKAHKKHLPSAYSSLLSLSSYITPCYGGSVQMACAMLLMQLVVRMSHGRLNWGGFSFVSSHKTCHFWHIQRQQGCPW